MSFYSQNIFPPSGNVGIGTLNPEVQLQIVGTSNPQLMVKSTKTGTNGWIDIGIATCDACFSDIAKKGDIVLRGLNYGTSKNMIFTNKNGGKIIFANFFNNQETASMVIDNSGSIGIGTDNVFDNNINYKLSVNGKVRARSVKVYNDWADYVFEDDYELDSLIEIEDFINKNGHLKGIPSAHEVKENGIDLGQMNKLLLEKIEELTLHIIKMDKEIQELKNPSK